MIPNESKKEVNGTVILSSLVFPDTFFHFHLVIKVTTEIEAKNEFKFITLIS
jgi:hypothetical protein